MTWNVQGLAKKMFQRDFVEFCTNNDIFSCSEINACKKETMQKQFVDFNVYVSPRNGYNGGGVAVFVRKTLSEIVNFIDIECPECVLFRVKQSYLNINKDLLLCFPYIPHYYSLVFENSVTKGLDRLIDLYNTINSKYGDVYWLIGGDLNARTGKLDDFLRLNNLQKYLEVYEGIDTISDDVIETRVTRDPTFINTYGQQLTNLCKNNNLYILNGRTNGDYDGKITCIANKGKTIVDYFIASRCIEHLIVNLNITPRPESDHFPLVLTIKTNHTLQDKANNEVEINCQPLSKLVWQNIKANEYLTNMNQLLTDNIDTFNGFLNEMNVEGANSLINECIVKASACMSYSKSNFKHNLVQPQWWDNECNDLKIKKYSLLRKFHQSNSNCDLEDYLIIKNKFKNKCTSKRKDHNNKVIDDLIVKAGVNNSREFWKVLNNLLSPSSSVQVKVNITPSQWYKYFYEILNVHTDVNYNDEYSTVNQNDTLECIGQSDSFNDPITITEIQHVLQRLKHGKACGSDGIAPEFYKINCKILVDYLCILFNYIFRGGNYPKEWCHSVINPIHKKGSTSDIHNYRGISLLNIISKIFTSVLHERLRDWADVNCHIPESQAGARRGYSTMDNIFCLQALSQKYISKSGGRFYILFIDFSKAYDHIDRNKLWRILREKGLSGYMLDNLQKIYDNVLSAVRVGKNDITSYFNCNNGLKQGCVLSTLLFSLYVSKLEEIMRNKGCPGIDTMYDVEIMMLMYIDDLCIFSDSVIDLQRKINILSSYCKEWGLDINTSKSKVMVVRNGGIVKKSEKWYFNEKLFDVVSYYSYLGLIVSSRLMWSKHIDNISSKCNQIMSRIRCLCIRYDYMPVNLMFRIFDTKVKPILLYGSEIWGVRKYEDIENIQVRYCKIVLNVGKTTWNFAVLGECGRYPMFVDYHIRAIKYWYKLITAEENKYNSKCYKLLYRLDAAGRKNWASDMRSLLCCLGFGIVWYSQTVGDIKLFISEIKERLVSISCQEWYERANHLCPEYLNYHPSPFAAQYTTFINSYHKRRLFALLRTKSLPIRNNLLRLNITTNNLCGMCNGVYVENEYHIFFRCIKYSNERAKYLPTSLTVNPSINKLYNIIMCGNNSLTNNIISFIQEIMKYRM